MKTNRRRVYILFTWLLIVSCMCVPSGFTISRQPTPTQSPMPTTIVETQPTHTVEIQPTETPVSVAPSELTSTLEVQNGQLNDQGPWLLISTDKGLWAINPEGTGLKELALHSLRTQNLQNAIQPNGNTLAVITSGEEQDHQLALNLVTLPDGKLGKITDLTSPKTELGPNSGPGDPGFEGARAITERKHAEEKIQRQLEHLTALSAIDRAISANFDLKLSLSEILSHVTTELGVDAAVILILHPNSQMLEFNTERGFRSQAIRELQVRLDKSYAGQAVLQRQLVKIPNLKAEPQNLSSSPFLMGEDFACCYIVPLIIKGQVKGVLEVFHRTPLEPESEWFDYLNTLAGQTAIAIENATLFEDLQRSNSELSLAYDETIEGWSHALDLRDKETEGHTQRVTDITVKLAHTFGLSEVELVQVRWGALLHDIGKMGVPDGILLKPGPLSDEEWVAMKKHPSFAYEMLAPIRYLRAALDIPYCHHEKWDGTGYPRGLKGEQIPLAARIFAVVDVWDALTSDRPYRKAWSKQKASQHIQEDAGKHFDPQVVKIFLLAYGQNNPIRRHV